MTIELPSSKPISIIIVDDDPIFRLGLKVSIPADAPIKLLKLCETAQEAIDYVQTHQVDVILMDVDMPGLSGIEATKIIRSFKPEQPILMLTSFSNDLWLEESLAVGALGFATKTISPNELVTGIETVFRGKKFMEGRAVTLLTNSYLDSEHPGLETDPDFLQKLDSLTNSERQVWRLVCQAQSNAQIANILDLQPNTVKQYLNTIYQKLQVKSRTELVLQAAHNHQL